MSDNLPESASAALWAAFLRRQRTAICVDRRGVAQAARPPFGLLPGSFNPLHHGHRGMLYCGRRLLHCPAISPGPRVDYELSLDNVDKPAVSQAEVLRRLRAFHPLDRIWLTHAPRFLQKAECFPGVWFLVGADTILRIADSRYYRGAAERDATLGRLERWGCRWLVFGRHSEGEGFRSLAELNLPGVLARQCRGIAEHEFRHDVSSTYLRLAGTDGRQQIDEATRFSR